MKYISFFKGVWMVVNHQQVISEPVIVDIKLGPIKFITNLIHGLTCTK